MIDDMRFMPAWHGLCRICTDEAEAPDLESGGFVYSPNNPFVFKAHAAVARAGFEPTKQNAPALKAGPVDLTWESCRCV